MTTVTLYQMKAWNNWQRQIALKKARQERHAAAMAVMKKPEPQQARFPNV